MAARGHSGAACLVAVFDTAFHTSLPDRAYLYALPYHLYARHRIRRYGFHGTSNRYVAYRYRTLRQLTREQTNVVTLHLGNGCSATAVKGGRPVDTSMGMTPLEGLVMGTRSGDLDPAILSLIATKEGLSPTEVEALLNTQCGLLGISGVTNDMKVLLQELREHDDRRIRLAIEIFCYRARKYIGALLAAMDGADAVIFTGGIGENAPEIRARICEGGWPGPDLPSTRKSTPRPGARPKQISTPDSRLQAWVIPTDEGSSLPAIPFAAFSEKRTLRKGEPAFRAILVMSWVITWRFPGQSLPTRRVPSNPEVWPELRSVLSN